MINNPQMKWILIGGGAAVAIASACAWYFFSVRGAHAAELPTYFTYSKAELESLKGLSSSETIRSDDLYSTDQIAFDLVAKSTPNADFTTEVSKIYANLAVAQRDFAFISHNTSGSFSGSVNPVSRAVLCDFFKDDCASIASYGDDDAYTKAITALVIAKIDARIAKDAAGLKPYPIKVGPEYWDGPQPSIGLTNGSSLGWFITSGSEFRAPAPPAYDSKEFADQLKITQEALKNATPEEKRATVFWAGGPGTKTPPGQLLTLDDDYMQGKEAAQTSDQYLKGKGVSLEKTLLVRSVLTMAVADAVTSVFDSKYTYFVKRPFMMDPTIITIMPTPNHPSYPAGHSTLSEAGAVVLEHYVPEDTAMWEAKAHEAGMSRVWGGIHYMMDHEAGVTMGKAVGLAAIAGTNWTPQ
jgi:hypothetical protein